MNLKRRQSATTKNTDSILIIYKYFSLDAIEFAKKIADYLLKKNISKRIYAEDKGPFKDTEYEEKVDIFISAKHAEIINYVITIGGDGTILWANHLFTGFEKPFFITFNLGTLGYLAYYDCHSYEKVFEELFINRKDEVISYENRSTLDVTFISDDQILKETKCNCLNDVVFEKGEGTHMIKSHIYLNNQYLTELRSDGMLVSTSTGSTAYNLSTGGSIIHYNADVLILNAICPFTLSFRPIVFSQDTKIKLILDSSCVFSQVVTDGINTYRLKPNEGIVVQTSPYDLKIIILESLIGDPVMNWRNKLINQLGWSNSFKNN